MDTLVSQVSRDDIDRLTQVLSRRPNYGIARPSQRWQTSQQEKIESLPEALLRPKNPLRRLITKIVDRIDAELLPPAAILCPCHEGFNSYLIRKIFLLLATEVTVHTDRLRSYPWKSPALASFITRIDSINAYWMSMDMFHNIFGAAPHDDRFVMVESRCEACILAAVGSNGRTLADLRAQLIARKENQRKPKLGHKKRPAPRLLRIIESWISHLKPDDSAEVRSSSDDIFISLREVQPALREYKKHFRSPNANQELRMGLNDIQLRQVPHCNKSKHRTRYGIPLPNADAQSSAAQRNLAALHRDSSVAKSVYRTDSVLGEGEQFSPEVIRQFREAFARSHPGIPVPECVPNDYDESGLLMQEFQRPGARETRQAHVSGTQLVEELRESSAGRLEHEIPRSMTVEGNTLQDQIPGGGYNDFYETEFDERDKDAEAISEAKVSEWFATNQTRVSLNEVDKDDLHPAFQQRDLSADYTTPRSLNPGKHAYTPARVAWRKGDETAPIEQEKPGPDPDLDAWTDATVYTTADAADEVNLSGPPLMPPGLTMEQQYLQTGYHSSGNITPTAFECPGSTTPRLSPSIIAGVVPLVSRISSDPKQATAAFPLRSKPAQGHFDDLYHCPMGFHAAEMAHYPPPPRMKLMGEPNKKYLFQDSDIGSRMTMMNQKYLKTHRGMKEIPSEQNPFLRQDRMGNPKRLHQETPNRERAPRPGNGTLLSRQEWQEQEWRKNFCGNSELRPNDSASNLEWRRKRGSVTTLGAFARQGRSES